MLPINLFANSPLPVAYVATFVLSVGLMALIFVGKRFARLNSNRLWVYKVPLVFVDEPVTADRYTKVYQLIVLFCFVLVPLWALVHCNNKVISHADIAHRESREIYNNDIFFFPDKDKHPEYRIFNNEFCMGQNLNRKTGCKSTKGESVSVEWYPLVSPLAMIVLSLVAFFGVIDYLTILCLNRRCWGVLDKK